MITSAQTATYWTFDNDNENFSTGTLDEQNVAWPFMSFHNTQWTATNGHEDGHIYSGTTDTLNGRFYNILQTDSLSLGNLSNVTLQTDLRYDYDNFVSPSGETLLAYWLIADSHDSSVCNMWLSKPSHAVDINALPQGTWVTQSIAVQEENFFPWANCPNTKTFAQLTNSYQYIGFSLLSDQVTTSATDPWNCYTCSSNGETYCVGDPYKSCPSPGVWRLLHYGAISDSGAIFRIDNFGPASAMIYDFGDLPDGYKTTHASNGPRHQTGGALKLGGSVQSEPDASPNASATGEGSEEDGVTRQNGLAGNGWSEGTVVSGHGGSMSIDIQGGAGYVQAFIDFEGTSTLTEVTLRDASGTPLTMPVAAGAHRVYFDIPSNVFTSNDNSIAVRVRLSSSGGLAATGPANDGEVEDYIWHFGPNSVLLVDFQTNQAQSFWRWLAMLMALTGAAIGVRIVATAARRR
jgi:hypothetical protein